MPLTLKQTVSEAGEVREAIRRRVTDEENHKLSEREIEDKIVQYLTADQRDTMPQLLPGNPLFSHTWRKFNKDQKLFVGMLNGRTSSLEEQIRNTAKESFGILNDVQQQALALDALITEEEIKNLRNFTTVHYNSFVRTIDAGLGFNDARWLVDFKTNLPFLPNNKANTIPGTGLTLPVRQQVEVPIIDIELVGEETDVGDSRQPIVSNSPRNLLRANKIFRHVIIRREFDHTSRKYNKEPSFVTLLLTLSNIQLINNMRIQPVGQSTITIEELSYINEAGEEILLNQETIVADTNILVLLEPIRTKYLKLKLRQFAPVTKTQHVNRDWRVKQLNDTLRGVGFSQLLDEKEEILQGRVFDFSLESIRVGLTVYEPVGIFRSKNIDVQGPRALSLSDRTQKIRVVSSQGGYGGDFELPDDTVLNEYYIGAHLKDSNNNTVLHDLIPIPDSYPVQREYLPLIGGQSKVKLFPDLLWNMNRIQIAEVVTSPLVTNGIGSAILTTIAPHGLPIGELASIVIQGPDEHPLNGEFQVFVNTDIELEVQTNGASTGSEITPNTLPKSFIYIEADQTDPIIVNREGTMLDIGSDYQVSLDGGITFYDDFPRDTNYQDALRLARAGRFVIKINSPQLDKLYWVQYRPLSTQRLGNSDLVKLRSGRVVFSPELSESFGTLNTVIISRADSNNPYVSPIIQFYTLKVRESVS